MIGIRRARLELQGFVPTPRLVVLGMDEKCPNTGDVGGCGGSEQCVLDERLAQASSLPGQVDRVRGCAFYLFIRAHQT